MEKNKRNIWIIAYWFSPNKRVGAMRASYWSRQLPDTLNANVHVITGELDAQGENIHVVPKTGTSMWTKFIADVGIVWKKNIQDYLASNPIETPDLVIITGGPFMHFGLTSFLKKKYGCKVILDYRDPFAVNPGFDNSWLKVHLKKWVEGRFNRKADGLITVNEQCAEIIKGFDQKPNVIAQNGFDESVECSPIPVVLGDKMSFSYAGKFYFDPAPIQAAIDEVGVEFHYIGPDETQLDLTLKSTISHGFVEYKLALEQIGKCDVGIIQTIGTGFQSTTKIFDYTRCERAILIVSNNVMNAGSLHDELKEYPNVFWAKNEKESIVHAIETIKKTTYIHPIPRFADKYSRKHQMTKVVELIERLLK